MISKTKKAKENSKVVTEDEQEDLLSKKSESNGDVRDEEKKKKKRKKERKDGDEIKQKEKKKKKKCEESDNHDVRSEKKKKRKKKKEKKNEEEMECNNSTSLEDANSSKSKEEIRIVASSVLDTKTQKNKENDVTLLLFYQYIDPPWSRPTFQSTFAHVENSATKHNITGRARVSQEGLNCTLTGKPHEIRAWIRDLRAFSPDFQNTEFKLTDDLPRGQAFPKLHVFEVVELVHYGLDADKAPPITNTGVHLEPEDYHAKMAQKDTVIIDVRNHYESAIGHFDPPPAGAKILEPKMRKSTEFPVWLDKKETKEQLKGKQVLMYCTGGIRCERASALLKTKMLTEKDTKELDIQGVYQLQGGIDKYFKQFPDGGFWKGKNYTFDKRFAHAPTEDKGENIKGRCEGCSKPWDKYRGKKRCPTCGVPLLVCRECLLLQEKHKKDKQKMIKCTLCKEEKVLNKAQIKEKEQRELERYRRKIQTKPDRPPISKPPPASGPTTRLFIKNLSVKHFPDTPSLCDAIPGKITHIQYLTDSKTKKWYGSIFVEMASLEDAARAVEWNGTKVHGRSVVVKYQKADEKDVWPLAHTAV